MSEEHADAAPKLETVRIFLKNGSTIDVQIPENQMSLWAKTCRSDGMIWTPDFVIPIDSVWWAARVSWLQHATQPQPVAFTGSAEPWRFN